MTSTPDTKNNQTFDVNTTTVEPLAVDAADAAALLGLSRSMFYKMAEAGQIGPSGVRLGRCLRYPLAELRAWAAAGMPRREEWERLRADAASTRSFGLEDS